MLEILKEGVISTGIAAHGLFEGFGRAASGFLQGDALAFAAKGVAGVLFLNWVNAQFPNFARTFHLDSYPGTSGPPPKGPRQQTITIGGRTFAVLQGPFDTHDQALTAGFKSYGSPRYSDWLIEQGNDGKFYIIQPGALGGV